MDESAVGELMDLAWNAKVFTEQKYGVDPAVFVVSPQQYAGLGAKGADPGVSAVQMQMYGALMVFGVPVLTLSNSVALPTHVCRVDLRSFDGTEESGV